ncbi:MAG: hypothetical protein J6A26_01125, partial [Oscillospiraceae bacterium]|nr:hypothetical protein [Oscillospiraceae bacterium]
MNGKWKTISMEWLMKWKEEKQRGRILLVLGIVGLCLILLSELLAAPAAEETILQSQSEENEVYITNMEEKLSRLVENVSGAGKCHVMITLEQGVQYVYASESKKVV